MATKVIIQEFGKNTQIMVTIPRALAKLLGYDKGKQVEWILDGNNLKLKLEGDNGKGLSRRD